VEEGFRLKPQRIPAPTRPIAPPLTQEILGLAETGYVEVGRPFMGSIVSQALRRKVWTTSESCRA
jgi:hypothetical protein